MAETIAFGIIAACMLGSGLLAVTSKKLVHSVLWLAATLVSTAALYVALAAPFLAAMQIVLYTGGVVTLMLFGVMLTDQAHDVGAANLSGKRLPAVLLGLMLFGLLAAAIQHTSLPPIVEAPPASTVELGKVLLLDHVVAFEALSVLLLATMIGAIVLARRNDVQD
jgi:NADH-quinone oxidoreductase subunit J